MPHASSSGCNRLVENATDNRSLNTQHVHHRCRLKFAGRALPAFAAAVAYAATLTVLTETIVFATRPSHSTTGLLRLPYASYFTVIFLDCYLCLTYMRVACRFIYLVVVFCVFHVFCQFLVTTTAIFFLVACVILDFSDKIRVPLICFYAFVGLFSAFWFYVCGSGTTNLNMPQYFAEQQPKATVELCAECRLCFSNYSTQ